MSFTKFIHKSHSRHPKVIHKSHSKQSSKYHSQKSGTIVGCFWTSVWKPWGSFWDNLGIYLGHFGDELGTLWGPIWDTLVINLGHFGDRQEVVKWSKIGRGGVGGRDRKARKYEPLALWAPWIHQPFRRTTQSGIPN